MSNHHHKHHDGHKDDSLLNRDAAEVLEPEVVSDEEAAELNDAQNEEVAELDDAQNEVAEDAENDVQDAPSEDPSAESGDDTESEQEEASCGEANDETSADKKTDIDWRDAYVRLAADFDNYRKRTAKEQDDIRRRERERVIDIWLDVYDNAERALASLPEKEGPWFEGFSSLVHQMDRCLATFHIRACDDMGKPFDPKRHEAIATCPNPAMENNMIMHIERRGFEYENGDIARVARVIVVRNPS